MKKCWKFGLGALIILGFIGLAVVVVEPEALSLTLVVNWPEVLNSICVVAVIWISLIASVFLLILP